MSPIHIFHPQLRKPMYALCTWRGGSGIKRPHLIVVHPRRQPSHERQRSRGQCVVPQLVARQSVPDGAECTQATAHSARLLPHPLPVVGLAAARLCSDERRLGSMA